MPGLWSDIRHACRLYWKTPWSSLMAVMALAVAMALATATSNLWSDLTFPDIGGIENDRGLITLAALNDEGVPGVGGNLSAEQISELNARSQTLRRVSGASLFSLRSDMLIEDQPVNGRIEGVLPGYFETLQPTLVLGRGLEADDFTQDGEHVLVLSHELWTRVLNADPKWIGQSVRLGDENWQIVGVAHPDFKGVDASPARIWMPYQSYFKSIGPPTPEQFLDVFPFFLGVARAQPEVHHSAISEEVEGILKAMPPSIIAGPLSFDQMLAVDGLSSQPAAQESARNQARLLMISAILICLVAAINVSLFLLVRTPRRLAEMSLRQALGATRSRLIRQILVESAGLVLLACSAGILLSIALAAGLRQSAVFEFASFNQGWWNPLAFAMASVLALALCVLVSLVPISALRDSHLGQTVRPRAAASALFHRLAGFIQLALGGLVAAVALAFLIHLYLLAQKDLGLDSEGVLFTNSVPVSFPGQGGQPLQPPSNDIIQSYQRALIDRVSRLEDVESVGMMVPLPGQQATSFVSLSVNDQVAIARYVTISPGLIDTLNIKLLHGRDFTDLQDQGVLVSRSLAEKLWGRTDVVGEFTRRGLDGETIESSRVIGVVDDLLLDHPDQPPSPLIFGLIEGFSVLFGNVVVKGNPDIPSLEVAIEETQAQYLPEMDLRETLSLEDSIAKLTRVDRARTLITASFALITVFLAGQGFLSMQRFLLDQQRRNLAVRIALGAGPKIIRRRLIKKTLALALPGVLVGGLISIIATAWLSDHYISRSVSPLVVGAGTSLILLVMVIIATLPTLLSAQQMRPAIILKED